MVASKNTDRKTSNPYKYNKRILRGLENASVVRLLIECVRDYHTRDSIVSDKDKPTREDIEATVVEILYRMEHGRRENPMPMEGDTN